MTHKHGNLRCNNILPTTSVQDGSHRRSSTSPPPGTVSTLVPSHTSELAPLGSFVDHSPLLASYRDMVISHLPVYSDNASTKIRVSPIGSVHCQNVTIRRKKGRPIRDIVSPLGLDPYVPSPSHIPLSTRLCFATPSTDMEALRALPLTPITK